MASARGVGPACPGRRFPDSSVRHGVAWVLRALVLLAIPTPALAAGTFYVDGSSGTCSDSGPGTEANPYCTISAAIAAHNGSGTTILVKPGVYREQVTVPASGSAGSPFVIQALGGTVVLEEADLYASPVQWTLSSGSEYLASAITWTPLQVFADGARLTSSTAPPGSLPANSFRYVPGTGLYVNVGGGNPALHHPEVGRRAQGIVISGRQYVTVDGFTVRHCEDRGISLSGATSCTVRNCTVLLSNSYGLQAVGCTGILVERSVFAHSNDHGMFVTGGTTASTFQDNDSFDNARPSARAANGINMNAASGNLLQRNRFHDNQDSGAQFYTGANDNVSRLNMSWNNGDHGYDHVGSTGTQHLGDLAYGNYKDGFSIEGEADSTTVYDCIAVDNGLTTNEFDLYFDTTSIPGSQSDYNIFWNSTAQAPFKYAGVIYSTLANYQAASGKDAKSKQADPTFRSAAGGDFRLLSGSPAIDCALTSVPNWPAADFDGRSPVDAAGVPNKGSGPINYADIGTFEFYPPPSGDHAPAISAPATVTTAEDQAMFVSVSVSDADGDAVGSLTADLSGLPSPKDAAFVTNPGRTAGTLSWTPNANDAGGPYVVTFTATNALTGTAGTAITVTNTDHPPGIAAPATAGAVENQIITVVVTAQDPDGQPISSLTANLTGLPAGNNAAFTADASHTTGTLTWTPTFADAPGPYPVTFTAANGLSGSATIWISVANVDRQPVVTAPATATVTEGQTLSFGVTASDPDGDAIFSLAPNLSGLPPGNNATFVPNASHTSGTFTWTPTLDDAPGPYAVTFVATNALSGQAVTSISVTNVDRPPVVSAPATATGAEGSVLTVSVTASDPDGQAITAFTANTSGLPAGNNAVFTTNPSRTAGTLTWTPAYNDAGGPYTVSFTATNTLSGSASTAITVTNTDRPPAVTAPASTTVGENSVLTLNVTANDPDGQSISTLTANTSGLPAGNNAVFTTNPSKTAGTLTWTPTYNDAGPYSVAFTATNALTGSASTTINVLNVDRAPVVSAPTTVTGAENTAITINVTASDPDGQAITALTANVTGLPAGNNAVFTTNPSKTSGTLVWTPTYNDGRVGAYTVSFTATNALAGSAGTAITVSNVDRPPVITAPSSVAASEGAPLTVTVTVADPDGQSITTLTADLSGLSSGATFSTNPAKTVGTLSWTPGYNDGRALPYPVTFSASNALSASAATAITVANVDRPPVVSVPSATGKEDHDFVLVVTASDPDGQPITALTADVTGLPEGDHATFTTSVDHVTGTLRWRPTFDDAGTWPVVFTATNALTGSTNASIAIQNTDRKPVVSAPLEVTVDENGLLELDVTASDPDGDPITDLSASLGVLATSGAVFQSNASHTEGTLTWTPGLDVARGPSYAVTFTATNAASGTATTGIVVRNVDQPPVVTVPVTVHGDEGSLVRVRVVATDPDGDPIVTLSADLGALPPGSDARFVPAEDPSVGAPQGPDAARALLGTRAPRALEGPGSVVTRTNGRFITLDLSANDFDGRGVDGSPAWKYDLVWTPTVSDAGSYPVSFTATNALSGSAATSIVVANVDRAPHVGVEAAVTATEGVAFSVQVTASDPDGDPIDSLTADLSGLPPGDAKFVADPGNLSGALTWTPAFADAPGPYVVTFTAANALAASAQAAITVSNVDRAPQVTVADTTTTTAGVPFSIPLTVSDPDGDPIDSLTADLSGLPAGDAEFVADPGNLSGTLTWTPTADDTTGSPYAVTFRAANALAATAVAFLVVQAPPESGSSIKAAAGAPRRATLRVLEPGGPLGGTNDSEPWWVRFQGVRTRSGESAPTGAVLEYRGARIPASRLVFDGRDEDHDGIAEIAAAFESDVLFTLLPHSNPDSVLTLDLEVGSGDGMARGLLHARVARVFAWTSRVEPNPVRRAATLSFQLPKAGLVRVGLYDASGRLVRNLMPETWLAAGEHHLPIGDVAGGARPPVPGVYFYRVWVQGRAMQGRFVVIR